MPTLAEARRAAQRLAFKLEMAPHFTWGPVNAAVLMLVGGATAAALNVAGQLPRDVGIAAGAGGIALFGVLHVLRRWETLLAMLLLAGVGLQLGFPKYDAQPLVAGIALATVLSCSVQVANQWDKAILLRLGEFRGIRGPGLFFILPFLDRIEALIDQRVRATDFRAERILTLDTVPVYVDAICFWLVWNAEKAVLEVRDYEQAVILSAQTALKDAVGRHKLADLLASRHKLGDEIQATLDEKTNAWGITLQSIEITDVVIPESLEEAMSKRAQAEREAQARAILSTAENEIAENFRRAARQYADEPAALHLRAMNMIYEGIRQRGSMIIVPSSAVETMGLGAVSGLAALAGGSAPEAEPPATEEAEPPATEEDDDS